MKSYTIGLVFMICLACSCKDGVNEAYVHLNSIHVHDSIVILDTATEGTIASVNSENDKQQIKLKRPTVASINGKLKNNRYLTILEPQKDLNILVKADSSFTTRQKGDSILNYLSKSNLEFANNNLSFIFETKALDSIPIFFDAFRKQRAEEINLFEKELSPKVLAILHYQNEARIYSFLLWLGRVSKNLEAINSYYDFVHKIPPPDWTSRTFPSIYLYKYEIEYLRKNSAIQSISDFLSYLEEKVPDKETTDLFKALYIKGLIKSPSYWSKHIEHFNADVLNDILMAEKDNIHYSLMQEAAQSFYKSQNNSLAYNFKAVDQHNRSFYLEDIKGKVVFIDVWATWCGPCIVHRPEVLELAKKYEGNDDVEIVMLSVDSSKELWLSFLEKEGNQPGLNLFIKDGMKTEFGSHYNVTEIPRYILIGKDSRILNSRIEMEIEAIEADIEAAMAKK
ncbi:TlpA family protein disulfide reductase [Flagellimonas algicola]|uniref:TlpA family protein disulfide reductase n=1 Tax=Flagellimonas algicola TaxID=2583815 RepID=A0ABY2WHX9_9FLAO|nr:TlpA disulfide reductase family protein [Allomuricauda algicola]TMU51007.1 TlpA family protein disulfide reductase [Allomuricauda algicola]